MHLNVASLAISALALAARVSADRMIVFQYCFFTACSSPGTWYTAHGSYDVDASEGCRNPDVPGMTQLCVDWGKSRGHFYFLGQNKRCIRETSSDFQTCSDDFGFATCSDVYWDEVPCTW
ncbi:hypothetical protein QBC42DRAFT_284416 [Cladorrhinum samala]|uniref:Secreted protein n=1 Tax=Cladorrhinum samala TaxID=585594 RepID=A0AAV9HU57_9PEZI|nr:hypothetical protein QBC42DRAFT_284416 [Cladorrhinum samala]